MKLLNLGCGNQFSTDLVWTNIDMVSSNKNVLAHDLKKGIPFPNASFDLVYHSHVLEHIPKSEADTFITECIRVLKPGGILRIVVPDLEQIALNYLRLLNSGMMDINSSKNAADYDWIMIEMYDQVVRNNSGGEMMKYILNKNITNKDFIIQRLGFEIKNILNGIENNRSSISQNHGQMDINIIKKTLKFLFNSELRRRMFLRIFFQKEHALLYQDGSPYQIGKFRESGEIHQWMYDRYSISRTLNQHQLQNIKQQSAGESYLKNWKDYKLEIMEDNSIYKPDSIYLEAIK